MTDPDSPNETRQERGPGGRFAPGNTVSRLGGRPPAAREAALYAAALDGLGGAEGVTAILRVVAQKALGGSAQHAAIAVRVAGLYRDDGAKQVEDAATGLGDLVASPEHAERVGRLLDEVWAGRSGQ